MGRRTSGRTLGLVIALLLCLSQVTGAQRHVDPGDAALAERFARLAQDSFQDAPAGVPQIEQATALLQAAIKLNPTEQRFPRLLADAQLAAGNAPAALAALAQYRALVPHDRFAQIQSIQLYAAKMNTADARIAYYADLLPREQIPTEVRSYAAVALAGLHLERSEAGEATAAITRALELNPLNIDALELNLQDKLAHAPPGERVEAILALLRANPALAEPAALLGAELAAAGLTDDAISWHVLAMNLFSRRGEAPPLDLAKRYAALLLISEQLPQADTFLSQLLEVDAADLRLHELRLLGIRAQQDQQAFEDALRRTRIVLQNRLLSIRQHLGDENITLLPLDATNLGPGVDVAALTERVKSDDRPAMRELLTGVLVDTAWIHLYFNNKPAEAAPYIAALKTLLPADSAVIARLDGWVFLREGKPKEATVKLSAVADRSFYASLGLFMLNVREQTGLPDGAADTLKAHLSGLEGAYLTSEARTLQVQRPTSEFEADLRQRIRRFPQDWLKILDQPTNFYIVRAEPVQIAHDFGEPMLVRVSIQNLGSYDLTIGERGVIRPGLWFSVQARGMAQQTFPAAAFDTLRGLSVLKPGQSIAQTLRLDQGELHEFLRTHPTVAIQLFASVTTNPVPAENGISAGPAGITMQFPKVVARLSAPLNAATRQRINTALESGASSEQMRTLQLAARYIEMYSNPPAETSEDVKRQMTTLAEDLIASLRRSTGNTDANIASWASFLFAGVAPAEQRPAMIRQMLAAPEWQKRLLALVASRGLPADEQRAIIDAIPEDADPIVAAYAQARLAAAPSVTAPAEE